MRIKYLLIIAFLAIWPLMIFSGDEEVAKTLVKKGDEALQKNDTAKAIELYKKALKEYPSLPEAYLKLGNAYSKINNKNKARRYFQGCIRMINDTKNPSGNLQTLLKDATNRLNNLSKNKPEVASADKKYIEQLLNFARRNVKKDIPLAESVLNTILSLDPTCADAGKLLQEMKVSRVIEPWQLVFNGENLIDWTPQGPEKWLVANGIITCDETGSETNFRNKLDLRKVYKLSMEFKIDEIHSKDGGLGIIIGMKNPNDFYVVTVFDYAVELITFDKKGKGISMKQCNLPESFKASDWNTLLLDISYASLKCYLNNILVMEYKADKEDFFWGGTGIWMQRSKINIRKMQYLKESN